MRARSHQPPGRGLTWPGQVAHAARGSTTSKTLALDRCQQLLEVTEERNSPLGLRDDDDDDVHKMRYANRRITLAYLYSRS